MRLHPGVPYASEGDDVEAIARAHAAASRLVVEVGTARVEPGVSLRHDHWAPSARWLGVDLAPGVDVDLVGDAGDLPAVLWDHLGPADVDGIVATSVLEHLRSPWEALRRWASCLRPGGWLYVCTHQTFPVHGYPSDYFRFTRDGLASLFDWAGLDAIHTGYTNAVGLVPGEEVEQWNPGAPAWLMVRAIGLRP